MKKLFALLMAVAILVSAQASTSPAALPVSTPAKVELPALNANQMMLPIGNTGKSISLMALSEISVKDFETISGKKLSFFDKIGFKLGQRKLRNKIEADGTIKSATLKKLASNMAEDGQSGFHIGGFVLGLLLGLIGVLIAYLIKDDKKSNRVKWAWIGWGVWVVIFLLTLL